MSRIAVTFVIAAFFTVTLAAYARSVTGVYHGETGAAFKPVLYDEKIPGASG